MRRRSTNAVDATVKFNWGINGPLFSGGLDNFLARWTGFVTVPDPGVYCFGARVDDGVRVWIDDTLVTDLWAGLDGSRTASVRRR